MIVFIVPLIAPAYCKNWRQVSALCVRTLRSITQQTSDNYQVILVCDEPPESCLQHPKISIIQEKFWLPDPSQRGSKNWNKREKHKRGLIQAREFDPDFMMFVDADDCISRQLANFVETRQPDFGCLIRNGYTYYEGGRWLYRRPDFDLVCGTSNILRCHRDEFPNAMSDDAENFRLLRFTHNAVRAELERNGGVVEVPFRGAVYMLGHGENEDGMATKGPVEKLKRFASSVVRAQPLTSELRWEFGIYNLALT